MITSSNGNIFRVTVLFAGNSPVTGELPSQKPVTRSFDVSFDIRLNKRLSKQSSGWWFETPSRSLWRHRYVDESLVDCYGQLISRKYMKRVQSLSFGNLYTCVHICHIQFVDIRHQNNLLCLSSQCSYAQLFRTYPCNVYMDGLVQDYSNS